MVVWYYYTRALGKVKPCKSKTLKKSQSLGGRGVGTKTEEPHNPYGGHEAEPEGSSDKEGCLCFFEFVHCLFGWECWSVSAVFAV